VDYKNGHKRQKVSHSISTNEGIALNTVGGGGRGAGRGGVSVVPYTDNGVRCCSHCCTAFREQKLQSTGYEYRQKSQNNCVFSSH